MSSIRVPRDFGKSHRSATQHPARAQQSSEEVAGKQAQAQVPKVDSPETVDLCHVAPKRQPVKHGVYKFPRCQPVNGPSLREQIQRHNEILYGGAEFGIPS